MRIGSATPSNPRRRSVGRAASAQRTYGLTTRFSFSGNTTEVRPSLAAADSIDAKIAITAALTVGTRPLEANALAQIGAWFGGAGQGLCRTMLWDQYTGDQLIVLAPPRGLVITNLTAWAPRFYVNVEFAVAGTF